jgi:hypothetical protein
VPDRACEMRINGGVGPTSRFCQTPPPTIPARFAISHGVHHFSKSFAIRKKLVDVTGIEPVTPCLQSNDQYTM